MLAVIAKLNVVAGKEEEFEAVMLDLAAKVNANEPGCHLYKLCKDADGGYTVMEPVSYTHLTLPTILRV